MSQGLAEAFASPLNPQANMGYGIAPIANPQAQPTQGLAEAFASPLAPPTQGLAEAFASPLAPQGTQGLAEAFASPPPQQPSFLQIEGRRVDIPSAFYNLSEEEQAKTIELLTDAVRKKNEKVQQISDFNSEKVDIEGMVQNADQSMKTYGDVSEQFAMDSVSSLPGALTADRALNALQSVGTKLPAGSRFLGPLAASMASAPEVSDFMTGQGEYDPQKHGISLEPVLPIDVGRIPYHFNRSVFGTHDPIGSAINYIKGDTPPSPTSMNPTPDSPGQGYRGEI